MPSLLPPLLPPLLPASPTLLTSSSDLTSSAVLALLLPLAEEDAFGDEAELVEATSAEDDADELLSASLLDVGAVSVASPELSAETGATADVSELLLSMLLSDAFAVALRPEVQFCSRMRRQPGPSDLSLIHI